MFRSVVRIAKLNREAILVAIPDALSQLRDAVGAMRVRPAPAVAFVAGATDWVAGANLQGTMEALAAGAGAEIRSAEAQPGDAAEHGRDVAGASRSRWS